MRFFEMNSIRLGHNLEIEAALKQGPLLQYFSTMFRCPSDHACAAGLGAQLP
jgi:hypothetical protein